MNERKVEVMELMQQFQQMRAKAYSAVSLKHPLNDKELVEFKMAAKEGYGINIKGGGK